MRDKIGYLVIIILLGGMYYAGNYFIDNITHETEIIKTTNNSISNNIELYELEYTNDIEFAESYQSHLNVIPEQFIWSDIVLEYNQLEAKLGIVLNKSYSLNEEDLEESILSFIDPSLAIHSIQLNGVLTKSQISELIQEINDLERLTYIESIYSSDDAEAEVDINVYIFTQKQ